MNHPRRPQAIGAGRRKCRYPHPRPLPQPSWAAPVTSRRFIRRKHLSGAYKRSRPLSVARELLKAISSYLETLQPRLPGWGGGWRTHDSLHSQRKLTTRPTTSSRPNAIARLAVITSMPSHELSCFSFSFILKASGTESSEAKEYSDRKLVAANAACII